MVADDLYFPEGPRWRPDENKLYFSDVMAGKVLRLGENGIVETAVSYTHLRAHET